jgi:nitrate/nitrite transporter NarK
VLSVFLPFAGGFFLSYLFRSVNAVLAPRLTQDLGLDAADLGLLTAAYFLAFAAFQIPLGVLLDRFGPRRVQSSLLLVAALGGVVFSQGEDRNLLILGRALIGLGFAGGLMASFKAIILWFPKARWPLVNGCFLTMGGLGAMAATAPLEALLAYGDWRDTLLWLSTAPVVVSAIIFLVVPERDESHEPSSLAAQVTAMRRIYADPMFWRIAPVVIACNGFLLASISLWAGPWLTDVAGFTPAEVADRLLLTTAFMTIGFVAGGLVADLLGRVGIGLIQVAGGGTLIFLLCQGVIIFGPAQSAAWVWIVFGLTANLTMLAYPRLTAHFPLAYAGRVNTGLNLLVFAAVFAIQYGMGEVIDLWPQDGGYPPLAYRVAFGGMLALQCLSLFWLVAAPRGRRMAEKEGTEA